MALPASGPISFSDINAEIRRGSTATTSLGEAAVRTTADRIASNTSISFSNLLGRTYGASTVLLCGVTTPRIEAYKWSQGFGTKYSNPASLPNGSSYCVVSNIKKTVVGCTHSSVTNRYFALYQWTDASGFGTRYTSPSTYPVNNPNTTLGGEILTFTPDGNAVIVSGSTAGSPTTVAWAWSDASGFGTKFSDPATEPPDANGIHVFGGPLGSGNAPDERIIFAGSSTEANRLSVWPFNSSTGWGAKMANPATMPASSVYSIVSDAFDVITGTLSNTSTERRSAAYEFDFFSGFGTRYSAMSTTEILGNAYSCSLSWVATGSVSPVVVYGWAQTTSGLAGAGMAAFPWSYGWGSKYADPVTTVPGANGGTGTVGSLSFNMNLDIAAGHDLSPYITVWPWNNGFGSKYADPSTLPVGNTESVKMATSFNIY